MCSADLEGEDDVGSLTPAQKLVLKVLEYADGPLSQQEIADESRLKKRTVRGALYELTDRELVEERTVFSDARQSVYRVDM